MGYLLVLAKLDADKKRTFGAIATAAKLDLAVSEKADAAMTWLEGHEPRVVVFDTSIVQAEKLCQKIRSKKKLATVPLIALVDDTADAFVERTYGFGADDVIRADSGAAIVARLRTLPDVEVAHSSRGVAVVADKEHARCDVFGRVLMNAGYDVKFALDDVALKYYTQQTKPRLVVASTELGAPRPLIQEARKRGCDAVWVVTTPRRELVRQVEATDGMEKVTVVANSTAPDNVLFMSNELLRGGAPPARAHERVLFGTVVSFKAAGSDGDDMGFTYNVSAGGLFVRTLAPPADDAVWLEIRPPRGKHRVRLEGRIAWRRFFDPASPAAVPPGFGVALTDGLGKGLDEWQQHVEAFIQSTRLGRKAVAKLLAETLRQSQPDAHDLADDIAAIRLVRDSLPDQTEPPAPVFLAPAPATAETKPAPPRPAALEAVPLAPPPSMPETPLETIPVLQPASEPAAPALEVAPDPGHAPEPLQASEPASPFAVEPVSPAAAEPVLPVAEDRAATTGATPKSRAKLLVAALVAVVLLGGGAMFALGILPGTGSRANAPGAVVVAAPRPAVPPPSVAVPPASSVAAPPGPSASAAPAPELDASPALDAAAAGDAHEAGTAPEDAASAALPAVEPAPGDGSELAWNEGYLVVRSSKAADVFATGFRVGPTNKVNKSKCGLKFVRLGEGDPARWLTKGKTIDVKCQATTTIELEPE